MNCAAATLISKNNHIHYTSSFKLDTRNIATAEICGILENLTWLLRTKDPPPSVHDSLTYKGTLTYKGIGPVTG